MALKKVAAALVRKVAKKVAAKKAPAKKAKKVQAIPTGYHVVTPTLVVRDAAKAIEFYKEAFGAKERSRMPGPGGKILHAEVRIGDSVVMLGDEFPEWGSKSPQTLKGTASALMIYTKDADALFARATAAGAKVKMPLENQFWGDRYGQVEDPFGHLWSIAQHVEDVSPKEMQRRAAQMGNPQG